MQKFTVRYWAGRMVREPEVLTSTNPVRSIPKLFGFFVIDGMGMRRTTAFARHV